MTGKSPEIIISASTPHGRSREREASDSQQPAGYPTATVIEVRADFWAADGAERTENGQLSICSAVARPPKENAWAEAGRSPAESTPR